jgi:Fe-S cluster biogenesis protein NfuA
MLERIEQVLDEKVRPALRTHDGDIKVVRVEDGVLYFRMLGQCSNCPSAVVTAESSGASLQITLSHASWIPELRQVVLDTTISDELWQDAMELLRRRHNGEA